MNQTNKNNPKDGMINRTFVSKNGPKNKHKISNKTNKRKSK